MRFYYVFEHQFPKTPAKASFLYLNFLIIIFSSCLTSQQNSLEIKLQNYYNPAHDLKT